MPSRSSSATRRTARSRHSGRGAKPSFLARLKWWHKLLIGVGLPALLAGTGFFVYAYVHVARVIDARLSGNVFNHASVVFAAPSEVIVGQPGTPAAFAARLRRALYTAGTESASVGTYQLTDDRLIVRPGPASFFNGTIIREGAAELDFRNDHLTSITSLPNHQALENYWLEPEVITTLFGSRRAKRRVVSYEDLPPVLVKAILAAEDHRFFSHHGVDFFRVIAAAITDLRADERLQGGSTLTMQLARNFFLTPRRTFRRKAKEVFIAFMLEQRLSKEQILGMYANQIYLGQRGSFSIYGVGAGANAYFNKDVGSLTLPQAALLAGMIRGPNLYAPYKYPERAAARRNVVLKAMADDGYIPRSQAEAAMQEPLGLAQQNVEASQAPYFVDMVRDTLLKHFSEEQLLSESYRIYTTLDLNLQRAASEAAREGMEEVDKRLHKHYTGPPVPGHPREPQLALVSLDPHTGYVRALVGGRNYSVSQFNHALARRQPGSSFKPFVYAAALNSALDGSQPLITPATVLMDEPTTFQFGDQTYEPENYEHEYYGAVSVREALMLSLNVATVQLAQMVGYDKIRQLAIDAGINSDIRATPAIALGAYVATPMEIAGSYTVFANEGKYIQPRTILAVNDSEGQTLWSSPVVTRQVLDPRISYLMVSLMQSVINNGTGYGVRRRGFMLPAAGKTGTSHDGWFAGFTSNLIAVVWVGYDNDRELNLAGASSALPVWTAYMKRATEDPPYQDVVPFTAPPGIVTATIDTQTNLVASASSTSTRNEVFVEGTVPYYQAQGQVIPGVPSNQMSPPPGAKGMLTRILHGGPHVAPAPAATMSIPLPEGAPPPINAPSASTANPGTSSGPHKGPGVFKKFLNIFRGKSSDNKKQEKTPPAETAPPPGNNP